MRELKFSAPIVEQLEFKKNKNFNFSTNEANLSIKVQQSDVLKVNEKEYYFCIKIIVDGEEAPFKISMEMSSTFNMNFENDKEYKSFIKDKGTQILTSYARPIITDVVVKAGFPPLIIPYADI